MKNVKVGDLANVTRNILKLSEPTLADRREEVHIGYNERSVGLPSDCPQLAHAMP